MPPTPRLRRGEVLAGVGALALLLCLPALGWARAGGVTRDGWSALPTLRWLIVISGLAGLALMVAQVTRRGPGLPVSLSVVATVLGALATLLVIIWLVSSNPTPQLGAYLGCLAAIIMTYGAFTSLRIEQGWTPTPERPIETVALSDAEDR